MTIRNRITELRQVRAGDLRPNPKNWRRHPKAQRDALRAVLDDVGMADALIAREVDGALELIDGHLRADLTPDAMVPVLVTDLDDAEADTVLATLDPLAAMAEADTEKLRELVDGLASKADEAMNRLLADMHGLQDLEWEETGFPSLGAGDRDTPIGEMVFLVSERQRGLIQDALKVAKVNQLVDDDEENDNSNGNALAAICIAFMEPDGNR